MEIIVDHKQEKQVAVSRIKHLLAKLKSDYGDMISEVHEKWHEDHANFGFKVMGFSVKGHLEVHENKVKITGSLPLAALPFRSKIENTIKEKATSLLA